MRHHVPCTTFALITLGSNTEFKLNLFKAYARARITGNFAVRNSVADTDDHELAYWLNDLNQ